MQCHALAGAQRQDPQWLAVFESVALRCGQNLEVREAVFALHEFKSDCSAFVVCDLHLNVGTNSALRSVTDSVLANNSRLNVDIHRFAELNIDGQTDRQVLQSLLPGEDIAIC